MHTRQQTYNICMTKHSHFPYTSIYSSTPHNTNTTSIISPTQTHSIFQHSKAKTHYFQQHLKYHTIWRSFWNREQYIRHKHIIHMHFISQNSFKTQVHPIHTKQKYTEFGERQRVGGGGVLRRRRVHNSRVKLNVPFLQRILTVQTDVTFYETNINTRFILTDSGIFI